MSTCALSLLNSKAKSKKKTKTKKKKKTKLNKKTKNKNKTKPTYSWREINQSLKIGYRMERNLESSSSSKWKVSMEYKIYVAE